MLLNLLALRRLWGVCLLKCGSAGRHCRTIERPFPKNPSYVATRAARNMVPRPEAATAQSSLELSAQAEGAARARRQAAERRSNSWIQSGASGGISLFRRPARRGVAPIQCTGRRVSHKLATYSEASIPSCSREVDRRVPVVGRPPAGVWSAYSLPIYRYLHRHLLRFTAVYAHLFETISLNSLALRAFAPFFRGCGSAARRRQGARRT